MSVIQGLLVDNNDYLIGTSQNDLFFGSLGNDTIQGGAGKDFVNYTQLAIPITFIFTPNSTKPIFRWWCW